MGQRTLAPPRFVLTFCSVGFSLENHPCFGAPGWLSWLSGDLQLRSLGSRPTLGSVLTVRSLEPALDSVCVSLSAPSPLMLCLSLSLKNK